MLVRLTGMMMQFWEKLPYRYEDAEHNDESREEKHIDMFVFLLARSQNLE